MKKRNLIIVSIIIVILALVVGIAIYINLNKLPKEPLDEEGILALLAKIENNDNICVKTINEFGHGITLETTMYKKDGIILTISPIENNTIISWDNMNTGESIEIQEGYEMWYNVRQNENKEEETYRFIRYEKYNNSKCAVIETILQDSEKEANMKEELITTARMWVDLKLGVKLKIEYINNFGEEYVSYSTVELNKVKDEDVQKPNLEGYTEYKYEESSEEN